MLVLLILRAFFFFFCLSETESIIANRSIHTLRVNGFIHVVSRYQKAFKLAATFKDKGQILSYFAIGWCVAMR